MKTHAGLWSNLHAAGARDSIHEDEDCQSSGGEIDYRHESHYALEEDYCTDSLEFGPIRHPIPPVYFWRAKSLTAEDDGPHHDSLHAREGKAEFAVGGQHEVCDTEGQGRENSSSQQPNTSGAAAAGLQHLFHLFDNRKTIQLLRGYTGSASGVVLGRCKQVQGG